MAERVECPSCGQEMNLPEGSAGKKVKCRGCDSVCRIQATADGALTLTIPPAPAPLSELTPILEEIEPPPLPPSNARSRSTTGGSRRRHGGSSRRSGSDRQGSSREGSGRPPDGATTIFVLGILGLVICGVCAPFAWVKGNAYVQACRRARVRPEGIGSAGRILGIIGTVYLLLAVCWTLFILIGILTMSQAG